jgi:amidase
VDAAAGAALAALRAQGAELLDVEMATYDKWNDPELTLMLYEFKDGLNTYLRRSGAPHATLEAIIAWNKAHAGRVMPFFGQELFEKAQAKGPLTDAAYFEARDEARRLAGKEGLLAVLDANKLDAVVAPSMAPAWPTDPVLGDHFVSAGYGAAAVAGTPSITVPMGESHGLPLGFVFMGRAFAEGDLLGMAFSFEQATKARKAPAFEPTLRQ